MNHDGVDAHAGNSSFDAIFEPSPIVDHGRSPRPRPMITPRHVKLPSATLVPPQRRGRPCRRFAGRTRTDCGRRAGDGTAPASAPAHRRLGRGRAVAGFGALVAALSFSICPSRDVDRPPGIAGDLGIVRHQDHRDFRRRSVAGTSVGISTLVCESRLPVGSSASRAPAG